jgi:hypothetical protein
MLLRRCDRMASKLPHRRHPQIHSQTTNQPTRHCRLRLMRNRLVRHHFRHHPRRLTRGVALLRRLRVTGPVRHPHRHSRERMRASLLRHHHDAGAGRCDAARPTR